MAQNTYRVISIVPSSLLPRRCRASRGLMETRVIGVTEEEFDSQNVCGIQAFPCTELYIL